MDKDLVVNASPLIFLSRIERLDLLISIAKSIVVPKAVLREIQAGSDRDEAAKKIESLSALQVGEDRPLPDDIRSWDLGAGESQVLTLGLARRSEVVLDDLAARRCAQSLGIPLIGTLGIVILCRQRGVLFKARPVVQALYESGLRLNNKLMDQALAKVGE